MSKLLRNYKELECEIFRTLLKHVSDHLSVFFFNLDDCTFNERIGEHIREHIGISP